MDKLQEKRDKYLETCLEYVWDMSAYERMKNRVNQLAAMSTEDIKKLWDEYDGGNAPSGIEGEEIHFELNIRGEGIYCAV